jgi:hypothetical protein
VGSLPLLASIAKWRRGALFPIMGSPPPPASTAGAIGVRLVQQCLRVFDAANKTKELEGGGRRRSRRKEHASLTFFLFSLSNPARADLTCSEGRREKRQPVGARRWSWGSCAEGARMRRRIKLERHAPSQRRVGELTRPRVFRTSPSDVAEAAVNAVCEAASA